MVKNNLHKTGAIAKKVISSRLFKLFLLWLAPFLILVGSFFTMMLNNFNNLEFFPRELILPLVMHAATALIIAIVAYFVPWPKSVASKIVVAFVLGMLMVGYNDRLNNVTDLYRAILPTFTSQGNDLPIISLVFLITLLIVAILIGVAVDKLQKKYSNVNSANIVMAIYIFVVVLFLGQTVRFCSMLPSVIRESNVQAAAITKSSTINVADKPDIYYIVLDRYTNNQVLKSQFNYSNEEFTNYLKSNDFYINEGAYSNYPLTSISMSSTLSAQYTKQLTSAYKNYAVQSRTLYHNLIRQSSVVKALKQNGYKYYAVGSWYDATSDAPLADIDYTHFSSINVSNIGRLSKNLRGVEGIQFNQSPFYQFFRVKLSWWPFKMVENDNLNYDRMQIATLNQLAGQKSTGGRFIFAHILIPHDPFVFNADGSINSFQGTDNNGETIKDKYVNQIKFINSQVTSMINSIKSNSSGKAVIILNADEGAYPQNMNSTTVDPIDTDGNLMHSADMSAWPDDWLKMKSGILQAVYMPGVSKSVLTDNLSSVNMFRIVLNNYLGYDLSYLPDCHYSLNRGDKYEYNYADITTRLLGTENPECKNYEQLK